MKVKQICHFAPLFLFIVAFNPLAMAAQPTFADLSVLLAKGYFKNHVPAAASLEECAAFLNDHGVCFSLFDLMDSAAVGGGGGFGVVGRNGVRLRARNVRRSGIWAFL